MRYVYLTRSSLSCSRCPFGLPRFAPTRSPLEVFDDMDHQDKYKAQASSKFFADGRVDRTRIAGTVAFGRRSDAADAKFLKAYSALFEGKDAKGAWVAGFPSAIRWTPNSWSRTGSLHHLLRTLPRCNRCARHTKQYGWEPRRPNTTSALPYHDEGEIFNTITTVGATCYPRGQTARHDRWAVIATLRPSTCSPLPAADVPPGHNLSLVSMSTHAATASAEIPLNFVVLCLRSKFLGVGIAGSYDESVNLCPTDMPWPARADGVPSGPRSPLVC